MYTFQTYVKSNRKAVILNLKVGIALTTKAAVNWPTWSYLGKIWHIWNVHAWIHLQPYFYHSGSATYCLKEIFLFSAIFYSWIFFSQRVNQINFVFAFFFFLLMAQKHPLQIFNKAALVVRVIKINNILEVYRPKSPGSIVVLKLTGSLSFLILISSLTHFCSFIMVTF